MDRFIKAYISKYGMTKELKEILEKGEKAYHEIYNKEYYLKRKKEKQEHQPSEKVSAILKDYENGMLQVDIARKYDVSRQYIFQVIKKNSHKKQ